MPLNDLVRRDVDRLDDLADGSGLDQLARLDGRFDLQPFAIHDGVDLVGFGDGLADRRKIFESGDARLVAEKVLAVLHGANADAGALIGDLRAEHKLGGRIVDDLVLRGYDLDVGKALLECGELVLLAAPGRDEYTAATLYSADHAIDMVVAHAADSKLDGILRLGVCLLARFGDFMGDMASARVKPVGGLGQRG